MKKATVKACLLCLGLCIPAAAAQAQSLVTADVAPLPSSPTFGTASLPGSTSRSAPTGLRVSEGSILHVGLGAEIGYDSNVFYSGTGARSSGLLIVLPYAELTNAPRGSNFAPSTYYSLGATLQYRKYLDSLASDRASGFTPTVNGLVEFGANQQLSLALTNTFIRSLDAPYVNNAASANVTNDPIKHIVDVFGVRVKYAPGGGRLVSVLQLSGSYDNFAADTTQNATNYSLANALAGLVALDVSWKWLPKTAVYARATQGVVYYTESNSGKNNSAPLHVMGGVRGLLTPKLSLNLALGYSNGFYSGGPSTGGVRGSLAGLAELGWTLQDTTSFLLGYRHDFDNAIIGNFYYSDGVYASLRQSIQNRIIIIMGAKGELRSYQGLGAGVMTGGGTRDDQTLIAGLTVDYYVQTALYVGVGGSVQYNHTNSSTSSGPMGLDAAAALDYSKYQAFVRAGVTY